MVLLMNKDSIKDNMYALYEMYIININYYITFIKNINQSKMKKIFEREQNI